jgi:hypothetical protein
MTCSLPTFLSRLRLKVPEVPSPIFSPDVERKLAKAIDLFAAAEQSLRLPLVQRISGVRLSNRLSRNQHRVMIPNSVAQLIRRRPSHWREAFDVLLWLQIAQKTG